MREIKFRGKRIDTGAWVTGHYFIAPLTDENSGAPLEAGWFFLSGEKRHCISNDGVVFVVDPQTVGQYTGLLDKNKKEIYEGDILSGIHSNYPVAWHDEGRWSASIGLGYIPTVDWRKYEIVGNIYENPELLK